MVYKNVLKKMLDDRMQFWNVKEFDYELREKLSNEFPNFLKFFKAYRFITSMAIILLTPFLLLDKTLPFASWYPAEYPYVYESLYALQFVMLPVISIEVIGFYCLFAGLCQELIVQFKLLNYSLRNLKKSVEVCFEETLDTFKICIDYHNFLLR